jgi:RHS repeat-associated protein
VERVVTKRVASATYESTFFAYAKNGQTVTNVVGEQWNDDGLTACFPRGTHGYVNTFGWEFRYDGARARYAARGLDPDRLYMVPYPLYGWSDYDGDEVYADFRVEINGPPPTTTRRFEPGVGRTDYAGSAYYHADHLGTIRGVTNSSAAWIELMAFTAFGERVVGTQDSYSRRYGYVGSFGYQSHPEMMPFLHVGARYYDPATGRFLQRDPIGIRGGRNVYEYVESGVTAAIDPTGLFSLERGSVVAMAAACAAWYTGAGILPAAAAGFVGGGYQSGDLDKVIDWITEPSPRPPPFPRGKCTRGCHDEGGPAG